MKSAVKIHRGKAAVWTSNNPVLSAGEQGWESDTNKMKIGDGTTKWTSLSYFADVSIQESLARTFLLMGA